MICLNLQQKHNACCKYTQLWAGPVAEGGRACAYILCFYEFQGYMETNFITDNKAACLRRATPSQAEVFTIDLTGDGDTSAGAAPGIFNHAAKFCVEFYVLGYSADGDVDIYFIGTVVIDVFVFRRNEFYLGKISRIEEVNGFQVGVSLLVFCGDRIDIRGESHFGCHEIVSFRFYGGVKLREFAADVGDHHVSYFKLYF